ncbi:MAG: hypothetical protein IJB44_06580 [Clostridia bacterium]|nr:hypothetical protein [Clostridia bacterium]
MKKVFFIFLCTVLLFALSSCDGGDKKMDGFTYEELGEYFSTIDGLTSAEDEVVIPCGEDQIYVIKSRYISSSHESKNSKIRLSGLFSLKKENTLKLEGYSYEIIDPFNDLGIPHSDKYMQSTRIPKEFAYRLEAYNYNSSPHWTEWVKYHIPVHPEHRFYEPGGNFSAVWYNPSTNAVEEVVYICEKENETEIYIIYQEIGLFNGFGINTYLTSEELHEKLKASNFKMRVRKKGTVKEFSDWFMCEYLEEIPPAFADIKAEYVYYGTKGVYSEEFEKSEYNDPSIFYEDLKNLGVNFDELRSYIIKATVPHNGTIQDIFWELIG